MGRVLIATAVILITACGRLGYDPNGTGFVDSGSGATDAATGALDATRDADVMSDAGTDAGADAGVGLLGPFGPAVAVASLNSPGRDDDPTLTADMLEIFFTSDRPGGSGDVDIWTATRRSTSDDWSAPFPAPGLNTADHDSAPEVSSDGLRLWLTSTRPPSVGRDPWHASRPDRVSAWGAPVLVAELATSAFDSSAIESSSRTRLVLSSERGGGSGGFDLYQSVRTGPGAPWDPPVELPSLNSARDEVTPHISDDFLTIYFASNRSAGAGGRDLYVASRVDLASPFTDVSPLTEVNTSGADTDPWVSPDARTLFFSKGPSTTADIFEARR